MAQASRAPASAMLSAGPGGVLKNVILSLGIDISDIVGCQFNRVIITIKCSWSCLHCG